MNFSEFKKRLGAEPRSQDPEFLAARNSNPDFRAAAAEAEAFEAKLEAAFSINEPDGLLEGIVGIPDRHPDGVNAPSRWRWLAAAAAFVAVAGMAGMAWYESTFYWESVDDYVLDHWADDGQKFVDLADGQADDQVTAMLARFGVEASPALALKVDYIHACHTPGSRGAHMVIATDQGPVTLIFMPKVEAVSGHLLAFDNLVAATLPLEYGSAVIIGPNEEVIAPVYAMARDGLRPLTRSI